MKNFNYVFLGLLSLIFVSCEQIEVDPISNLIDSNLVIPDKTDSLEIVKTDSLLLDIIESLKSDIIAYYPFNGDVKDYSGKNHDGESFHLTPTTDRFNRPNSAYYFDGASSFIKVYHSTDLALINTNYTVNYWINLDGYNVSNGSAVVFKRGEGSNNGWLCSITGAASEYTNVGKVGVVATRISAGDDPLALGNEYLNKNKWYMITSTYDVIKKEFRIYVNGKLDTVTQNIPSPNPSCIADMYIGRDSIFPENGTDPYYLKGKLDDIFIYGSALSKNEIYALFIIQDQINFDSVLKL